jgi:hypothetical protein
MTQAATIFLDGLDESQRAAAQHVFTAANRTNWSNVPMFVHPRPGVRVADLSAVQRQAAHDLIRASVSSQGYQKLASVMRLDGIHRARELEALDRDGPAEDGRPYQREEAESFGTGSYGIAILGDPVTDADWAWVIQGHHLAANFTVVADRVAFTPLFLGATPLILEDGLEAGWSPLPHEVERGFALMRSLNVEQQRAAWEDGDVPGDVLFGVGYKNRLPEPSGLKAAEMTATQRRLLRSLVTEYVGNAAGDVAQRQIETISNTGWEELWFSWRGQTQDPKAALYYRIQGPRIFIELSQRPKHVHTIVRDPGNDYGEDWSGETLIEDLTAADRFDAATRAYEAAQDR